jgi:ABC-type glycerol-3-phosphate transport system substrate-binding protein
MGSFLRRLLIFCLIPSILGCPSNPSKPLSTAPTKPFAGLKIRFEQGSTPLEKAFCRRASGWASRSEAIVEFDSGPADIRFVDAETVGDLAAKNAILPVPIELKATDHSLQWDQMLSIYRDRRGAWAGESMAIPLAGRMPVLVCRVDRLANPDWMAVHQSRFGVNLPIPPRSWEDIAEISETLAARNVNAIGPRDAVEFYRIAACLDRMAMTESQLLTDANATGDDLLSFVTAASTGEPRLTSACFVESAALLARIEPARIATGSDVVAALADGTAALSILSLEDLARLQAALGENANSAILIAPLPGTRTVFDHDGKPVARSDRGRVNYIPLCHGERYGVVMATCANPAAAWDLLADLASPARSIDLMSDSSLGVSPFRGEHLLQRGDALWARYGFDMKLTQELASAVKSSLNVATVNTALLPRGPDSAKLFAIVNDAVTAAASGTQTPSAAMAAANRQWLEWSQSQPDARSWRRRALGLK